MINDILSSSESNNNTTTSSSPPNHHTSQNNNNNNLSHQHHPLHHHTSSQNGMSEKSSSSPANVSAAAAAAAAAAAMHHHFQNLPHHLLTQMQREQFGQNGRISSPEYDDGGSDCDSDEMMDDNSVCSNGELMLFIFYQKGVIFSENLRIFKCEKMKNV